MLLKILSEKKIKEHGGIIPAYVKLNKKHTSIFDFDKVWEVVDDNKNYLNATLNFDETQLKHYTTKFRGKFKDTIKVKDVDWEELVIDLMVIMLLRDNLPKSNPFGGFRFN